MRFHACTVMSLSKVSKPVFTLPHIHKHIHLLVFVVSVQESFFFRSWGFCSGAHKARWFYCSLSRGIDRSRGSGRQEEKSISTWIPMGLHVWFLLAWSNLVVGSTFLSSLWNITFWLWKWPQWGVNIMLRHNVVLMILYFQYWCSEGGWLRWPPGQRWPQGPKQPN